MEFVVLVILVIAIPIAVMIRLTPRRRAIAFVLGLVFTWDFALLAHFSEGLTYMLIAPAGVVISLAALLVEIPAFVIRTIRGHRGAKGRRPWMS